MERHAGKAAGVTRLGEVPVHDAWVQGVELFDPQVPAGAQAHDVANRVGSLCGVPWVVPCGGQAGVDDVAVAHAPLMVAGTRHLMVKACGMDTAHSDILLCPHCEARNRGRAPPPTLGKRVAAIAASVVGMLLMDMARAGMAALIWAQIAVQAYGQPTVGFVAWFGVFIAYRMCRLELDARLVFP